MANVSPPFAPSLPTVVTVPDAIWIRFPSTMARRATSAMTVATRVSVRRAARVIAPSQAAKHSLTTRLGVPQEKVDVIEQAPASRGKATSEDTLRRRLGLGTSDVILCVAQKREHKNLLGLVRALPNVRSPAVLVAPGTPTPHEDVVRAEARALGVADRVFLVPWLSREDLSGLYDLARCFVLPSFEEGFGMPVLEAMASGAPVACSAIPAFQEVAGDAAVFFDPSSAREIAHAVECLLDDSVRDDFVERGRAQAAKFDWQSTAAKTLEVYRRACSPHSRT
jgi:glycosyltransferase involved in cell wall biosynthesis